MDCHECKEKMLLFLDNGGRLTGGDKSLFENHIKSCASCAKEVRELKESLRLVKDKEVFIPEVVGTCHGMSPQIERTELELPQVIKNAVRQDAVRQDTVRAEYPACHVSKQHEWFMVLQKEYKMRFTLPSLKIAYAMAILLCVGLGIYFITFMTNKYTLVPKTKVAVMSPMVSEEKRAESSPVLSKKENKNLFAANKTKEKTAVTAKPAPAKTATPVPVRKELAKDTFLAKKEVLPAKTAEPAPQDKVASGANIEMVQKTPMPESKATKFEENLGAAKSITVKSAYIPAAPEFLLLELSKKLKKIVSEYKDVTFAIKKEQENFIILLSCPKDMKKETIEELKTKITVTLDLKKDKDKIIILTK